MPEQFIDVTIRVYPRSETGATIGDVNTAVDFFTNWVAEGNLTDNLNPALSSEEDLEMHLKDSAPNYLEFEVYKV